MLYRIPAKMPLEDTFDSQSLAPLSPFRTTVLSLLPRLFHAATVSVFCRW
jgi:hypothetical protein